jgi:heat shock protein HslJ
MIHSALVRVSVLARALALALAHALAHALALALAVGVLSSPLGCTAREPIKDGSAVDDPAQPSSGLLAQLVGPEWICVEIDGAAIGDGVGRPTLRFGADGRVSGRSPVNQYGADFTICDAGTLELGLVMSTLMAGSDEDMRVESAFMRALQASTLVGRAEEKLVLSLRSDGGTVAPTLVFERMPAACGDGDGGPLPPAVAAPLADFAGAEWSCIAIEGEPLPADATIAVTINADGSLQGHGGVNRFAAACARDGDGFRIGPIVATEMAGPPAAGARERRFFAALESARSALCEVDGELSLRDGEVREILRFRRR